MAPRLHQQRNRELRPKDTLIIDLETPRVEKREQLWLILWEELAYLSDGEYLWKTHFLRPAEVRADSLPRTAYRVFRQRGEPRGRKKFRKLAG